MNKISKQLFSLAKILVADKTYKVVEGNHADVFSFNITFSDDWKYGTKLNDLKIKGDSLIKKSTASLEKLKASFKAEGYVKEVGFDEIKNVYVLSDKITCNTVFTIKADLSGSGTEYSWDRTIDILKRFNFVAVK